MDVTFIQYVPPKYYCRQINHETWLQTMIEAVTMFSSGTAKCWTDDLIKTIANMQSMNFRDIERVDFYYDETPILMIKFSGKKFVGLVQLNPLFPLSPRSREKWWKKLFCINVSDT
jgi:hypothetical protein